MFLIANLTNLTLLPQLGQALLITYREKRKANLCPQIIRQLIMLTLHHSPPYYTLTALCLLTMNMHEVGHIQKKCFTIRVDTS